MTKVYYSRVLDAPVDQVWNMVRDFGGIAKWFPFIPKSVLRDHAAPTQIGAVRDNTTKDGGIINEQLVAFSELERSITYDVIAGEVPMTDYTATLSIYDVTEDGRCFAVWTAEYNPTGDAAKIADWVRNGIFQTCLANLEDVLRPVQVQIGQG